MMGVAKVPEIEGKEPKQFFSVVSVRNGIAMDKLKELHSKLEKYWIKDCPNCVIGPKVITGVYIINNNFIFVSQIDTYTFRETLQIYGYDLSTH